MFKAVAVLGIGLSFMVWRAEAETYRWVDAQGQVHFSDQPVDAPTREIKNLPSTPAPSGQAQRLEKTRKLLDAYETERRQAREQKAEQQAKMRERKQKCFQAKDDLRYYRELGAIYDLDDKGERVYLNEHERAQLIEKQRRAVERWCG